MSLIKIYILFLLFPLCHYAQSKTNTTIHPIDCDSSLITLDIKHIELLDNLIAKAQQAKRKEKIELERQFFCAMPNSNDSMLDLIYLDEVENWKKRNKTGKLPATNSLIHRFISYFSKLESIDPNQYYNKYINICVDGFYGADYNRNGFQIYERLENDTKTICAVLLQRNETEIISVFRFIFDSSHPKNEFNQDIFDNIYPLIKAENKRLAYLFKKSLEDLIKQKHH
ncbi:hypothetical protein [Psychroserpens sp. SPM9]|uniref:hypothetical protein n=1 Tax=Psychroserpens sp. SPM9 TaxID=2975598 RepID=UPI0021A4B46D|nr:hypothetical protein [Psychroserpens sp. SPM9]MDG5492388.1 hypothetical protein [Psychroserpens sp. SPM9]